jgi:hypothetical protein
MKHDGQTKHFMHCRRTEAIIGSAYPSFGFGVELTDGTVYYQSEYKYHYPYAYRPVVKIYSKGSIQIIVPDGMNDYVEVEQTTAIKSKIVNEFNG